MQTVVTHSGSFDPDDVLAVASLQLFLGVDQIQIIRSRQQHVIDAADWAVDVGGAYDVAAKRFDHHQNGVPKRENGVPYSAFGLVWREIGEHICGSAEAAAQIEKKLVQPVDAADNHVTVCHPGQADISAFEFYDIVDTFKPTWGSDEDFDSQFLLAVDFARSMLTRMIAHAHAHNEMHDMIKDHYHAAPDKAIIQFPEPVPRHALVTYEDVLVVVSPVPASDVNNWMAAVVPINVRGFQNRVVFPEPWAGLVDKALENVSGVDGAVFCHKERYIFVADSKEGALEAANHALG